MYFCFFIAFLWKYCFFDFFSIVLHCLTLPLCFIRYLGIIDRPLFCRYRAVFPFPHDNNDFFRFSIWRYRLCFIFQFDDIEFVSDDVSDFHLFWLRRQRILFFRFRRSCLLFFNFDDTDLHFFWRYQLLLFNFDDIDFLFPLLLNLKPLGFVSELLFWSFSVLRFYVRRDVFGVLCGIVCSTVPRPVYPV